MGSITRAISRVADDVLGFDPNGGGIHDVPVIGDIVDDQLGADPGESPLEQLGSVAATIGAGVGAAGLAGVGPAAGLNTAITQPVVSGAQSLLGGGAAAAPGASTLAGPAASAAGGLGAAGAAAGLPAAATGATGAAGGAAGTLGTLGTIGSTIGSVAQGVGGLASGVGALAETYDAITGGGADADREQRMREVAEIAGLTVDELKAQELIKAAASDPRIQEQVDRLYGAGSQGATALRQGLDTLTGIATGSDAAGQRLASQAAAASQLGASQAGALGSARQQRAAQAAAADVLAARQQSAANTLTSQGRSLLGEPSNALALSNQAAQGFGSVGLQNRQQQQALLDRNAQVAAAQGRTPTTAETVGRVAGGLEALPTAINQTGQGVNQFLSLFR